jgi:Big-like domain-containing protein
MNSTRVRCLIGLVVVSAAACSSDTSGDDTGSSSNSEKGHEGPVAGGKFEVFPPEIFTGTDGSHTFKAPVITVNSSGPVTWTIADPSIAQLAPDAENVMITATKAGDTMITATSGGKTSTATLHVVSYTTQQYEDGMKRYVNGLDAANPACKECHAPGKGPDHTATELDADPDSQVQNTFLTGVDPEDRPIKDNSEFANLLKGKSHMWTVTESEKVGLVAYLRSLPPMGYPEYDAPTTTKEN